MKRLSDSTTQIVNEEEFVAASPPPQYYEEPGEEGKGEDWDTGRGATIKDRMNEE